MEIFKKLKLIFGKVGFDSLLQKNIEKGTSNFINNNNLHPYFFYKSNNYLLK